MMVSGTKATPLIVPKMTSLELSMFDMQFMFKVKS